MVYGRFLYIFLFFYSLVLWPAEQRKITIHEERSCRLLSELSSKNSRVALIECDGLNYLVRQKIMMEKNDLSIISSVFASMYAFPVKELLIQDVWVIPSGARFPGKFDQKQAASLHSFVSGRQVKEWQIDIKNGKSVSVKISELFENFSVRLADGFTNQLLETIERHEDLPRIVAYCFLLGYQGCHGLNIFYDDAIDRFILIDMDSCFKYKNFEQVYNFLKNLIQKEGQHMTKQRKIALLRFADALELFMQENSISSSINKIKKIASLVQNKKSSQNAIAQKIVAAENSLQSSYVVAKKVCALIYENVVI